LASPGHRWLLAGKDGQVELGIYEPILGYLLVFGLSWWCLESAEKRQSCGELAEFSE